MSPAEKRLVEWVASFHVVQEHPYHMAAFRRRLRALLRERADAASLCMRTADATSLTEMESVEAEVRAAVLKGPK